MKSPDVNVVDALCLAKLSQPLLLYRFHTLCSKVTTGLRISQLSLQKQPITFIAKGGTALLSVHHVVHCRDSGAWLARVSAVRFW